jgi:RNA polymerase sigma factor FliA
VHDLAQIAAMALVTQVDTFDYTVNDRFDLYASRYITGRMLDHLRSLDPLSRHTRKVVRAVTEASTAIETAEGRPATEDEVASRTGKTVTQIRDARAKEETSRPSVYEDVATVEPARLPSPESMFMVNRVSDAVAEALEDMDFATQYIVALKYYLNQSLSSIAESTGLPETVVSRLHAKAVERVRETVVKIVVESGAEA